MTELRKYQLEYAEEFARLRNNPNISANGFDRTPNPYTLDDALELFKRNIDKNPAERFLIFSNGELCGEIGIWPKDDIHRLNVEIGYFIGEPFWGRGIATEAIALMTGYVFENFNVIRIFEGFFEKNKS